MDRLQSMQTFVRVVETGNFSVVAREQSSTQSAVSKQVAALERHLGTKLLTRTTRALSLTQDGMQYFEEARRLVAEVSEAESRLRSGEQKLTGWLRVAASVGYGLRVLMPRIDEFMRAHPAVKIDFKLDDGFVDLVAQGIDVAARIGELHDSTLVARRIGYAHRAVLASRDYLKRLPAGLSPPRIPDDLRAHNCVVYTELNARNVWDFEMPDGSNVRVPVEGNLRTNSSEVVRAAGLAGMGICYSPTWLFSGELARGQMQVLLPEWPISPLPINLVSPEQRRHSAKVKMFADFMAQNLEANTPTVSRV
ncbi:MAG: LysR family transcriptional regulator [Hyphomicrobium sp.]|nr:LysR family transcriptional regulator [Hyphomicrobium sp.]